MDFLRHNIKKCKEVFEAYGSESSRDTFSGELNCDAGKMFHMMLFALVAWLLYIPTDLEMHKFPTFAVCIRFGLTVLAAILIALKFTKKFRNYPTVMFVTLVFYINVGAAILAGTAGDMAANYISGFSLVFMINTFITLSVLPKVLCSVFAFGIFFVIGAIYNLNFDDHVIQYSIKDTVVSLVLSILFSCVLNNVKRLSWERNRQLKAASKTKSEFLAKMSHEIRTPMNAITGMAELAMREELPPAAKEHVHTIRQAGSNLLAIINDILDLSKIESGRLEIVPVEYQLRALVDDVVSIIRMRVVESPVRFVVNVDCNIPNLLFGDEVRVRQTMLNVLGNAVKYTSEGFVSLQIKGRVLDSETVVLSMEVADTGKGIKEEDIGKLFGSFVQVDVEANRGIEGTGLGLAITKNLVKGMGGEITVESVYGKGSIFTIMLPQKFLQREPLAKVHAPENKSVLVYDRRQVCSGSMILTLRNLGVASARAKSDDELRAHLTAYTYDFVFAETKLLQGAKEIIAELGSNAQLVQLASFGNEIPDKKLSVLAMPAYSAPVADILNGVIDSSSYAVSSLSAIKFCAPSARVLVVDDIRTNLEVAKGLLTPYKMIVDTTLSGAEAVRMASQNSYDIIFMDHMMPDMNGIEATRLIRELGGGLEQIPIIALTANAVAGAKEMFLQNRFNGFLSKPIDVIKLNEVLERFLPVEKRTAPIASPESVRDESVDIVINGVDVHAGMLRTGGKASSYLRTLAIFCDDGKEKIAELTRCMNADNFQLFATHAHALKSASANIGAHALSESARALEMAGKNSDRLFIKLNTPKLISNLEKLLVDIAAVVSAKKQERSDDIMCVVANKDVLIPILQKLQTAIDNLDAMLMNDAVKELEQFEDNGDVSIIMKCVLNGDYDEAEKIISKFI